MALSKNEITIRDAISEIYSDQFNSPNNTTDGLDFFEDLDDEYEPLDWISGY